MPCCQVCIRSQFLDGDQIIFCSFSLSLAAVVKRHEVYSDIPLLAHMLLDLVQDSIGSLVHGRIQHDSMVQHASHVLG